MPNSRLVSKQYPVPEHLQRFLGPSISYENLKMTKTRMTRAKVANPTEFQAKGGDEGLKWVEQALKTDRDSIHNAKQVGMKTGRENQFKKPHDKDKDNANPTGIGELPKLGKGSINRKLIDNKEVYNEAIEKEIQEIKYLIEYMNNKKQNL